ncbi:MAG: IS1 family transposase [Rhodospirillales bacterium]
MNKLPIATRAQILSLLCEGASMRAVSRLTDTSINTVAKLLVDTGKFCAGFHDAKVRGVKARRVQVDEIWSFCYAKARNVKTAKAAPSDAGDVWTWTAIEADTKLIVSHLVGGRDGDYAREFMCDVRDRLANRVQLTSDGHRAYLDAVETAFGDDVDYAMLEKLFGQAPEGQRRYSPPVIVGTKTTCCTGKPDPQHISTSYAERQNLTMRMHMRRFTRLTNGFSKKFDNHTHMVAIYAVWYNWIRIHKTLRVTPAMAASLTDRLWIWEEIVAMMDADQPTKKRGPYKNRTLMVQSD